MLTAPKRWEEMSFDLYDERWRDCWLAATSTVRLRRKQVDMDIRHRVQRLLEAHGPETLTPLSLRVYGTMIKGPWASFQCLSRPFR